jgi:serine/threonine-protein kinase
MRLLIRLTTTTEKRTSDNGQRATGNEQRITSNGQRTTSNGQRTTDHGQIGTFTMIPPGNPSGSAGEHEAPLDDELIRVMEGYLAGLEAGRPPDLERLLAEHPALAGRLRDCLAVMEMAQRLADSSGAGLAPGLGRGCAQLGDTASASGRSVRAALRSGSNDVPQVHLRDLPDEPEPLVRPGFDAIPSIHEGGFARFQLQGEIARGGMGAILKGRDVDLGRDLAIKVLLESHQRNPEVVRRFVEEAQIGGQLQHPGIVPVYELGTFPDRRPFFAMKLVKGRTLASLLQERAEAGQDLSRLLSIFEQVCQTVAYAHARGVIHRDLKPSNVMVGSFGEVQVMDWGLAKVLPQGGIADEAKAQPAHETVIMTVRSGSAGSRSESQAGSVLGTPAYMAPEQARGEVERIDERADVFGLGAILCEILTGQPPFAGETREEIHAQSARGDVGKALARLEACGAEVELIDLARDCLAPERARRPRSAGHVSSRMKAFLAGLQERLRAAELARVEAQARAGEERKRRRLTVALAAAVLAMVGSIGGGWAYLAAQRTARLTATTRVVTEALAEAEHLRGQAQSAALGDLTKWAEAIGAARHGSELLAQGEPNDALRSRVMTVMADLQREQAAARELAAEVERDRKLLGELETIRTGRSEHLDPKRSDGEYAAAFRKFGIDLDKLDPEEAGRQIGRRSAPVELASYLDDWALMRRGARGNKEEASWRRILGAAQTADPDPWRMSSREQIGRNDRQALQRLAKDENALKVQPARSLVLLALVVEDQGDRDLAEQVLRRAWRLDPADFWINYELGLAHQREGLAQPEEAARFFSAAVSLRPRSEGAHNNLGDALNNLGRHDEAIAELREAVRLKPDRPVPHNNLGLALYARARLSEAIAEYREALRLKPDYPSPHTNLGLALIDQGKLDEGIAECSEAVRLKPDYYGAHHNLGIALAQGGRVGEAIAQYREALRLKPDHPNAHANLGVALRFRCEFSDAVVEFRKARDLLVTNPRLAHRIDRDLADTEQEAARAARLPAVLAGKHKPVDAAEALGFARLCHQKQLYGVSARLWTEAFKAQPELAGDMQTQYRYDAACAAALAGCGHGKDDPPLDEAAKARWRKQGIDWLKPNLAFWSKEVETGMPQVRGHVAQILQHWKADPDLAGLREPASVEKLPKDEQDTCRALWATVDALFTKTAGAKS